MSYSHYLADPRWMFEEVRIHISDTIVLERMVPLTANPAYPRLYHLTSPTVNRTVTKVVDNEHAVLQNGKLSYLLRFQNYIKQVII